MQDEFYVRVLVLRHLHLLQQRSFIESMDMIIRNVNVDDCLKHCPSFCRGDEVSEDEIANEYFVGYEIKKSLLEVRQTIYWVVCKTSTSDAGHEYT